METESLRQSGLEKRELLLDHAGVNDENKVQRRGVFFDGEVLVGDEGVMRKEVVAGEAERADPDLGGVIEG
ncbi:transport protein SEC23-like [Pyrus ussuriensis x Pyrus communis]|uniref:Transport protein SEC23-like n=1 Tax=Pyrus ussuriensis x Pyrus communis TaxID=2448454 RepID=A0A5N5FXP8_9ROSA|nr:transport protein SEC23-like [Pyrus ussuriensis x Pyrus communis]